MNYEPLGQLEQQETGLPFSRLVIGTDFDRTARKIADRIRDYYQGIDLLNPGLWRKLGWNPSDGPVGSFLRHYITLAGTWKESLNASNRGRFTDALVERYDTPREDAADYVKALLELSQAGQVPDSIRKPWTYEYEPPSIEGAARKAATGIILLVIGGIAVYGIATTAGPQAARIMKTRSRKRKKGTFA